MLCPICRQPFSEPNHGGLGGGIHRRPKVLAQLSKDAGVTVGSELYVDALSKAGGPADSYLNLMRHNVTQLVAGMKQN